MEKFTQLTSKIALIDRVNIDTDIVIPKQYLKSIKRTGFGAYLFDDWRYLDKGSLEIDNSKRRLNPDFLLNHPPFNRAKILIAGENFGCGSSREHAVWSLLDFGFKVILAPSFGDIFYNNSLKNGLLAIEIPNTIYQKLSHLFNQRIKEKLSENQSFNLTIDLINQTIHSDASEIESFSFEIDAFRKESIVNGEDEIEQTLKHQQAIKDFEVKHYQRFKWLDLEKIN